ncbi:hypothetical protein F2Q69_00046890 [Brassica cretica]|uniref:Uncharacterized protein n=1 Tax=Brassica cretica TaxID=69181 RepID=A0A8S9Q2C0_BRACR|nr:hypothetical protein F2Q69_00046890 [Brassica cretica]
MVRGLIGLLILCLECVTCFSSLFSGGIVSIGRMFSVSSLEFGRLDIQGVWTEQRFPLSSYEVSGSWSYRLAGEAAALSVVGYRSGGYRVARYWQQRIKVVALMNLKLMSIESRRKDKDFENFVGLQLGGGGRGGGGGYRDKGPPSEVVGSFSLLS